MAQDLKELARRIAEEYGIPPYIFLRLITRESGWNPQARGRYGEIGLGQLLPSTARGLGVRNPWDPEENLRAAARYLRMQYDRFGSWYTAALAYNAGPGSVLAGRVRPESHEYARFVAGGAGGRSAPPVDPILRFLGLPAGAPTSPATPSSPSADPILRFLSLPRTTEQTLHEIFMRTVVPTPAPTPPKSPPVQQRGVPSPVQPFSAVAGLGLGLLGLVAPDRLGFGALRQAALGGILRGVQRLSEWALRASEALGYLPQRVREEVTRPRGGVRVPPEPPVKAAEVISAAGRTALVPVQMALGAVSGVTELTILPPRERERVLRETVGKAASALREGDLNRAFTEIMASPHGRAALGSLFLHGMIRFPLASFGGLAAIMLLSPHTERVEKSAAELARRFGASEKQASSVGGVAKFLAENLAWAAGGLASLGPVVGAGVIFRSSFYSPRRVASTMLRALATGDVPEEVLRAYYSDQALRTLARSWYHGSYADQMRILGRAAEELKQRLTVEASKLFEENTTMHRAFTVASSLAPDADISQKAALALVLYQAKGTGRTFSYSDLSRSIKNETGLEISPEASALQAARNYVNSGIGPSDILTPQEVAQLVKAGLRANPLSPLWYEDFAKNMRVFYGHIQSPNLQVRAIASSAYLAAQRPAIDEIRAALPLFNAFVDYLEKNLPEDMKAGLRTGRIDDLAFTEWLLSRRSELEDLVKGVEAPAGVLGLTEAERAGLVNALIHGVPGGPKTFGYWTSTLAHYPDERVKNLASQILSRYVRHARGVLRIDVPRGKDTAAWVLPLEYARESGIISDATAMVRRWNSRAGRFEEVPTESFQIHLSQPLAALDTWVLRVFGERKESIRSAERAFGIQKTLQEAARILNEDVELLNELRRGYGRPNFQWTTDAVQATLWVLRRSAQDLFKPGEFTILEKSMAGFRAAALERMALFPEHVAIDYRNFLAERVLASNGRLRTAEAFLRQNAAPILPKGLALKIHNGAVVDVSGAIVRFPSTESARDHALVLSWALGKPVPVVESIPRERGTSLRVGFKGKTSHQDVELIRSVVDRYAKPWILVESGKNEFFVNISGIGEKRLRAISNELKKDPRVAYVRPDTRVVTEILGTEEQALGALQRILGVSEDRARSVMEGLRQHLSAVSDLRAQVTMAAVDKESSGVLDDSIRTVLSKHVASGPLESSHPSVREFVGEVSKAQSLWKLTLEILGDESGQIGGKGALRASVSSSRYRRAAEAAAYETLLTIPPEGRTLERFIEEFRARFPSIVQDLEDAGRPYYLEDLYRLAVNRSLGDIRPWDSVRRWLTKEVSPEEPRPTYAEPIETLEETLAGAVGLEAKALPNVLRGGRVPLEEQLRRATANPEALAYDLLMVAEQRLPELGQMQFAFAERFHEILADISDLLRKAQTGGLTEDEISALGVGLGKAYVLLTAGNVVASEAGRGLRTRREIVEQFRRTVLPHLAEMANATTNEEVRKVLARILGAEDTSPASIVKAIRMLQMDNPSSEAFLKVTLGRVTGEEPHWLDKAAEYYRSNLLFSVPTHLRNLIGTALYGTLETAATEIALRTPLERAIATIGKSKGWVSRFYVPTKEAMDWFHEGLALGMMEFPQVFARRFTATITANEDQIIREGIRVYTYGRYDKPIGYAIRLPYGVIAATDGALMNILMKAKMYESAWASRAVEKAVASELLGRIPAAKTTEEISRILTDVYLELGKLPEERGGWAQSRVARLNRMVLEAVDAPVEELKSRILSRIPSLFSISENDRARTYYILQNGGEYLRHGATAYAKRVTFNKDAQGVLKGLIDRLHNSPSPVKRFLGKVVFPFVRTPWNIVEIMVTEMTPVAMFRVVSLLQKGDVEAAAATLVKVLYASSLFFTGMAASYAGVATGILPDDPQYKNMRYSQGDMPVSIRAGNHVISMRGLSPVLTPFFLGATAAELAKYLVWKRKSDPEFKHVPLYDPGFISSWIWAIARHVLLEESFLRSWDEFYNLLFRGGEIGLQERLGRYLGQIAAGFVPASRLVGTIADLSDPYVRERRWLSTKSEAPTLELIEREVFAVIPGLRQRLPIRMAPLGEPVRTAVGTGVPAYIAFLWPVRRFEENPIYKEWERVGVMVPRVLPRVAGKPSLSELDVRLLTGVRGAILQAISYEILGNPEYARAPDEVKREIWRRVFRKVSDQMSELRRALEAASDEEIAEVAEGLLQSVLSELRSAYPQTKIEVAPLR
jgi:hypothetical protein